MIQYRSGVDVISKLAEAGFSTYRIRNEKLLVKRPCKRFVMASCRHGTNWTRYADCWVYILQICQSIGLIHRPMVQPTQAPHKPLHFLQGLSLCFCSMGLHGLLWASMGFPVDYGMDLSGLSLLSIVVYMGLCVPGQFPASCVRLSRTCVRL